MYKRHLLNNIEKELKICRRLYTKISEDQLNFRPKDGTRSIYELLQYLTIVGTAMPIFWLQNENTDFGRFFSGKLEASKEVEPKDFLTAMEEQIQTVNKLFDEITDEDLYQKTVQYPWSGITVPLGEGIIDTSIKWLAAYKLQLFNLIKYCSDVPLATPDAWTLTELD